MSNRKWPVRLAGALLALAALAVALGLWRLSRPDPELTALLLNCTAEARNGWSFETEDGPAEPEFGFGGYFQGVPAETPGPVAASRVMDDPGERNLLELSYYHMGIQVFLDDELLYTDFPNEDNRADAFLTDVDVEELGRSPLYLTLPEDCAGRTLRIITYGGLWDGLRPATFPSLVSRFSDAAMLTADTIVSIAAVTALSLLGLLLLLMFLLGAQQGRYQWELPPLALYFLLAAVPVILRCFAAEAAGLDASRPMAVWVSLVYLDFLVVFLALELKGWRRWMLLCAAGLHVLLSLVRVARHVPALADGAGNDPAGLVLLGVTVAMLLLSWREKPLFRWGAVCIAGAAAAMFAVWGVSCLGALELLYPLSNPVSALLRGDPRSFYTVLCAVAGAVSVVWVAADFVRGVLERRRQAQALEANHRLTLENYQAAEEKLRLNAAMRHEWKNQVAALHLLQRQGDLDGLGRCLEELDRRLDRLAPRQYTEHLAINTILQNAAARAEELGVAFHAAASVPPELGIDTGDLCALLLNLLDNALEGAARVPASGPREVDCAVKVRQGYLAIRCENSYAGPPVLDEEGQLQSTKAGEGHGFGLAQMRAIAEKYGSVLDISYTEDRFTVQTALKLK